MQAVKIWLKVTDVAEQYNVSPSIVRRWITKGINGVRLPAVRPGGAGIFLIKPEDVEEFMKSTVEGE